MRTLVCAAMAWLQPVTAALALPPVPPQIFLDTREIEPTGRTFAVNAGDSLQAALDAAAPGDLITLQAGAVFTGPFTLPAKSGDGWITVRTSTPARLPPFGSRAYPSDAEAMPRIVTPDSGPALRTASGAHHYRFVGIEFAQAIGVTSTNALILLEAPNQISLSQVPHDLVFDRVYAHGRPTTTLRRAFAMNSARTSIINSFIADCHEAGADSQAIVAWNGPGPFKIVNNYLEAAGENVMFGGADPSVSNLIASDIEIRGNYFSKPLTWMVDHASYAGTPWTVKNLFELKNAQRVLVDGNVFEHSWPHGQNGFAVVLTVRNDDGSAPWSVVQDVTFTHNIVRKAGNGVSISGTDDLNPSQRTRRILIKDNLFVEIGGSWGMGRLFQVTDGNSIGTSEVVIDHNTAFQVGPIVMAGDAYPHDGFIFQNNIAPHNEAGIFGSGSSPGNASIERYFPMSVIIANLIIGGESSRYPAANFFPVALASVGFVDVAQGDYRLAAKSPYKGRGSDGKDPGADIGALLAATRDTLGPPPPTPLNLRINR